MIFFKGAFKKNIEHFLLFLGQPNCFSEISLNLFNFLFCQNVLRGRPILEKKNAENDV